MAEFKTEKVSERVTRIYAVNTELMYLVEGTSRAALLDTGSGFGSLKRVVETLTDKPVIVLLTHGHTDHAMGAGEFEEVYMNHEDDDIYQVHGEKEFRWDGMKMSEAYDKLEESDYIETKPLSLMKDMKAGDVFDLGELHIDVYDCKGHTKGSLAMLIREERMLLTGDGCNPFTFLFEDYSLSVTEYEEELVNLKKLTDGRYDRILLSHGDGEASDEIIEGVIKVCEEIKAHTADDVPFAFKDSNGLLAKKMQIPQMIREDDGCGNIVYNPKRI